MNKKGFTLVEVIMSIVLVSVVLTFMLASLVKLRNTYSEVNENTDALIFSSSISRIINNDLYDNGGIRYVGCNIEGDRCDIILSNSKRRRIVIIDNELSDLYTRGINASNEQVSLDEEQWQYCDTYLKCMQIDTSSGNSACTYYCPIKTITTTLKYLDTTENDEGELIYIKTLSLTQNTDLKKDRVHTVGYNFGKMSYTTYEFESANKFVDPINKLNPYRNVISSLSLQINDTVDKNDNTYGITLYSSASYPPGMVIGDEIKLTLDSSNETIEDAKTITSYYDEIVVKYGVSFNVYVKKDGVKTNQLTEIKKLNIPVAVKKDGSAYKFNGYYYRINREDGSYEDIQIIDENGNILVTNTYFIEYEEVVDGEVKKVKDRTLFASWS
ncbi:MAG: prepilin-type N-terminal cleavage/methylation domain-containing protein [bacterium]|nr:prepilin-type N-terminal cleavage/methylation domain-containing protein [bacterium]